jgi:hypothetical protein
MLESHSSKSTMQDNRAKAIAQFRWHAASLLVLRQCLHYFFVWTMIWATGVVVLRAIFRIDPTVLWWGAIGLLIAAVVGVVLAIRQIPTAEVSRAVVDRHSGCGGLLMAAADVPIGVWGEKIACVSGPKIAWRSGRQWAMFLASAAFLAAAFLAPDRYLPSLDANVLHVDDEIQKLAEKVKLLKQEKVLSPQKAEALEKDLERVRKEATGKDPAKTMEAMDHLEQSLKKTAAEAAESSVKQAEKANRAEELAKALQAARGQMDPKQFSEAMKEMSRMANEAAAENKELQQQLSKELQEACKKSQLSDEQLKELAKALKECKSSQQCKLGKLAQGKLVDAEFMKACNKAGKCDEAALAKALCNCKKNGELESLLCNKNGPGGGGPSAPITWSEEVKKGDAVFKEKILPPANANSLKGSQVVGMSAGTPTTSQTTEGESTGGALQNANAGGGESHSQVILPEHEKTVRRYFDRQSKP